jgi:catechol 2,3-dioxygenase-like lactoylglutathione lyase family enzyme
MKVKRIMSNTATSDLNKAKAFYGDTLGLELLMDHGWFQTYGSDAKMTVQVSFGSEGGSGTPVPDLSVEVDDIQAALARFKEANVAIEYGPVSEPWGVRRFYVRDPFGKLSTSCNISELITLTLMRPGCQGAAADALKRAAELGRSASSGQPRVFKER